MRTELRFGFIGAALLVTACAPPPSPGAASGEAAAAATGPEQACKRASELALAAGEPAEVAAEIEKDCVARMGELQGYYGTALSCMEGAADLRQLKTCELPVSSHRSMFASLAPSPEALCDHVVGMMMTELADQVPQDQLPMIRDKCVGDAKRNAELQGDTFVAQARCIMSKNTIAGLRECEGTGGPAPSGPPPAGPPPAGPPPAEPGIAGGPPPGASPQIRPPADAPPPAGAPAPAPAP